METPHETQYCLDTVEPDGISGVTSTVASGRLHKTYFIRCRPTLRWWTANQYNCSIKSIFVVAPKNPLPTGRIQIAVYRQIVPIPKYTLMNRVFAEMVPGTYYDTGSTGSPINLTMVDFDEVLVLGGSYWIVVRLEDTTASGLSSTIFAMSGFTIADSNCTSSFLEDTSDTISGSLPTSYNWLTVGTMTAEFPWIRADLV